MLLGRAAPGRRSRPIVHHTNLHYLEHRASGTGSNTYTYRRSNVFSRARASLTGRKARPSAVGLFRNRRAVVRTQDRYRFTALNALW